MTVPKMMIIQNILLLICTTLIFFIPIVEAAEFSNVTIKPGQTNNASVVSDIVIIYFVKGNNTIEVCTIKKK